MGDRAGGKEDFRRALEIAPDFRFVGFHLFDEQLADNELEEAEATLRQSMQQTGSYTQTEFLRLRDLAGEMQRLTTYSDDQVLAAQRQLNTFGLWGDSLDEGLRAAMDLAAGLNIDLNTAIMMVGKAAVGETQTLGRYGIVIDENVSKADKFQAVLGQVNARFGGAEQARAETTTGKIKQMGNAWDDCKEALGGFMVKAADLPNVFGVLGRILQ